MSAPTNPVAASAAPQKKKSNRKLLIIVGVLGLLVVVAAVFGASRKKETGIPVTTEKAVVKTITHLVTATGKVQKNVLRDRLREA